MLNNTTIHWLSMLETMTGCRMARLVGTAGRGRERAPVVPGLHDLRAIDQHRVAEEEAHRFEWRACDADESFAALLALRRDGSPGGDDVAGTMTATTQFSPVWPPNGWRLYGDRGALLVDNSSAPVRAFRQRAGEPEHEPLPLPREMLESMPNSGDALVDMWKILAREFVGDIRGEAHGPYPTFRDGRRLQVALDAIRLGTGWAEIPD
jgi:predicted dehydrogenase